MSVIVFFLFLVFNQFYSVLYATSFNPPPLPPETHCEPAKQEGRDLILLNCQNTVFWESAAFLLMGKSGYYDPYKGLVVHATDLRLEGNFKLPSQNVFLVAESVTIDTSVTFDLSGNFANFSCNNCTPAESGMNPGDPGFNGRDGGNGGNGGNFVLIVAGDLICKNPKKDVPCLTVFSNGGNGGNGQPGGDGAIGAIGTPNGQYNEDGGPGGQGGQGGRGGSGGDGGNGGAIFITYKNFNNTIYKGFTNFSTIGGTKGSDASGGQPGPGGPGGAGGEKHSCHSCWLFFTCCSDSCCRSNGATGPVGNPAPPPDHVPVSGKSGSVEQSKITPYIINNYITDDMLSMALDQALAMYKENKYSSARDHFLWIIWVVNGQPLNGSVNGSVAIQPPTSPSSSSNGTNCSDLYRFAIGEKARVMVAQMALGIDYFGNSFNYCPPLSQDFYNQKSMGDIQVTKVVEEMYIEYQKKNNSMNERLYQIQKALDQTQQLVDNYDNQIEHYWDVAYKESLEVEKLTDQWSDLQSLISRESQTCLGAIDNEIQKEEKWATWEDIFKIAGSVLSFVSGLKSDWEDFEKMIDDMGKVDFHDLFHDFDTFVKAIKNVTSSTGKVVDDIKSIWEEYKDIKNQFDQVKTMDQKKLVTDMKSLDKLVSKYLNIEACFDVQQNFQKLLEVIRTRNDHVQAHDTAIINAAKSEREKLLLNAQYQKVQSQLVGTFDPDLFAMVSFMQSVYYYMLDLSASSLSDYYQAQKCAALTKETITFSLQNSALLDYTHALIRTSDEKNLETNARRIAPMVMDLIWDDEKDSIILSSLKETGNANITIRPINEEFRGFSNVWIDDFSFCFEGVETAVDEIRYIVSHAGSMVNIDPDGGIWTFSSPSKSVVLTSPVTKTCRTSSNNNNILINGISIQSLGYKTLLELFNAKNICGRYSPFSIWSVEVPEYMNPGLNIKGLRKMVMSMSGSYQPMNKNKIMQVPYYLGGPVVGDGHGGSKKSKKKEEEEEVIAWTFSILSVFGMGSIGYCLCCFCAVFVLWILFCCCFGCPEKKKGEKLQEGEEHRSSYVQINGDDDDDDDIDEGLEIEEDD